jgi:hypothetical protein
MKKIPIGPHEYIYDLHYQQTPHWYVQINYSDGISHYKSIPNDRNSKELQEEHVLDLFIKSYVALKYSRDRVSYEIIGRDADGTQRHDYTVNVPEETNSLAIEITKLTDSSEVHIAHRLRDTAAKIIKKHQKNFFAFLPHTMSARDLEGLFDNALSLPVEEVPEADTRSDLISYIDALKSVGVPYIRLINTSTQIHTTSNTGQSLREAVREAIVNKESKDYLTFKQEDMILVIDDKSLRFSREYIDKSAPLLETYFMGTRFKEVYILSRKSSPTSKRKVNHEVMLTPIKCSWNRAVFSNIVYVLDKLNRGESLPLNF